MELGGSEEGEGAPMGILNPNLAFPVTVKDTFQ